MAGEWIKMRAALMQTPELISMARVLQETPAFRDWLTPGGGGLVNGQLVSNEALRCVTCAALLRVWSAAREHGKFDGDDLILPFIGIPDLDLMAGIPGVGEAMQGVAWAVDEECQIRLPKFLKHNVPPQTNAERQAAFRERNAKSRQTVTKRNARPVTYPLPEKRRVKKNTPKTTNVVLGRETWLTPIFAVWEDVLGGKPPNGQLAKYCHGLVETHGSEVVCEQLRAYLSGHTGDRATFIDLAKFAAAFGQWGRATLRPTTAAGRTMQNVREFLAERKDQ